MPLKKVKKTHHRMGPWRTEQRDRQVIKTIGRARMRGRITPAMRSRLNPPLSVYKRTFNQIYTDLGTVQLTNNPKLSPWRHVSPFGKLALSYQAMCERDGWAFTVHIHPEFEPKFSPKLIPKFSSCCRGVCDFHACANQQRIVEAATGRESMGKSGEAAL